MITWISIQRLVSLLIGLTYTVILTVPFLHSGAPAGPLTVIILERCLFVAVPVALIWFPETIGSATGMLGNNNITADTPPFLVSFMGWVFLLGAPVVYFLWH